MICQSEQEARAQAEQQAKQYNKPFVYYCGEWDIWHCELHSQNRALPHKHTVVWPAELEDE